MLTAAEIESLSPGWWPNSRLRATFGAKHGHVIKARTTGTALRNPEDYRFIGNRRQYRFRVRNPLGRIVNTVPWAKPEVVYHDNRFENRDRRATMHRVMKLLSRLFKFLFG